MKKLKEILLNAGGNIIYLVATWFMTVLVVRLGDFKAAGAFSLAITITAIFYCVSMFGMRSFQVSDVTNQFTDQEYFISRFFTAALGFVLCILYCCLRQYSGNQIRVIALYMLYKTIEAFADVSYGYFQKYSHFDYIFWSLSIKGFLSILVFFFAMYLTQSLVVTLILMVMGIGCFYLFYDLSRTKQLVIPLVDKTASSGRRILALLSATVLLMVINLVMPVLIAIPRVYFEAHYGAEQFGYFSSISAPTVIISTFVSCAMMPFLPHFAQYQMDCKKSEGYRLLFATVGFTLGIGVLCYFLGLWLGDFALTILYTNDVLQYSYILPDIIVSTTCSALVMCLNSFFIATRKMKTLALLLLVGCGVSYLLTPLLIQKFEMVGISYTLTISQLIQAVGMFLLACRDIHKWKER